MAYTPISNEFIQHAADASGNSASGYYIKAYASGTSTPISIALDSAGSTLVAKVELDSLGYAQNASGGSTTLYIDQTYRLVLYVNSTDADANTFANAVQDTDLIPQLSIIARTAETVKNFATLAAAVADTGLVDGDALNIAERTTGNGGGAMWDVVLSSTVTENALNIVQATGVGTLSLVQRELERPYGSATVAALVATDLIPGQKAVTTGYYDGWGAVAEPVGAGRYTIATLAEVVAVRGVGWVPDESIDHTMANGYVAVLIIERGIDVRQAGARGDSDGTTGTDDTAAIQAAYDYAETLILISGLVGTVYFPVSGYTVSSTIIVKGNTYCDAGAVIYPEGMAANDRVMHVVARTTHENIFIEGDSAVDPANGTIGIKVGDVVAAGYTLWAAARSRFINCQVVKLAYGVELVTFSTNWTGCRIRNNTTNVSMHKENSEEVNDTLFSGGNYGGATGDYAFIIGDDDFSTGGSIGNTISLENLACDGGTVWVNRAIGVALDTVYSENPSLGKCVRVGKVGEAATVENLTITRCQFRTADYAVYHDVESVGLNMSKNNCSGIAINALYTPSDIYAYTYEAGTDTGSFSVAPEVHTGMRGNATANFGSYTNITEGIIKGRQSTYTDNANGILPRALLDDGSDLVVETAGNFEGRVYETPTTGIGGNQVGKIFTCTTAADALKFNGGDEIIRSTGANTFIEFVDYDAGTIRMKVNDTQAGITIDQRASIPSAAIV